MRKFATAEILSVQSGTTGGTTFLKSAHRAVFQYEPKHGMIYVRSRAISSRCNDNYDMFPADEIAGAYRTFIGKPVFVNHHNDDHKRMRGLVIDAALHRDRNPDGSPDTWVEVLMEIDALRFPKLAKALVKGWIDRTSMGCDVQTSRCSICANVASTPLEYCAHIPGKKGQRIVVTAVDGRKEARLVYEECRGLSFFENSVLVEPPADPTAFRLGNVEFGPGLQHLQAMRLDKPVEAMVRTAGVGLAVPELSITARTATRKSAPTRDDSYATITHCEGPGCRRSVRTHSDNHETNWEIGLSDNNESLRDFCGPRCALAHMDRHPEQWDLTGQDPEHPSRNTYPEMYRRIVQREGTRRPFSELASASQGIWATLRTMAMTEAWLERALRVEATKPKKPTSEMSTAEYAEHQDRVAKGKSEGEAWNKEHPVHVKNIVGHWLAGTDDEHANGENWYADAHHLAKHIATDTRTPMHVMAGLMSNYSPQTHWSTNIMNAARVARTKVGLGGKGDGVMATTLQKRAANRMLGGEHYDSVLAGPKTRAFAHLIEHGGNADPDDPKVVVDRHALSVAAGARATDNAYMHSKLGTKGRYHQVSQAYHQAAQHISQLEGRRIEAHQVQAATWLTRQRLNEEDDRNLSRTASSGSTSQARLAVSKWNNYAAEHHPAAMGKEPGTGYSQSQPEDVVHAVRMDRQHIHNPKVAGRAA